MTNQTQETLLLSDAELNAIAGGESLEATGLEVVVAAATTESDAYVRAICNGVSVLAWARVDGIN